MRSIITLKDVKPMPLEQKKRQFELFVCVPHNASITEYNSLQGIIYPSGTCVVGVDAWRDLDKHDCSSHETKRYDNIQKVMEKYRITKKIHNQRTTYQKKEEKYGTRKNFSQKERLDITRI